MENKLKQIKTELNSGKKLSTLDVCLVILSVLAIFCVIFSLFFMTVKVKQSSMLPSLSDGDILLALKTKNVDRGDIVVYRGEETDGELIIKRVIALEGDTFEIDEEGVIREIVSELKLLKPEKLDMVRDIILSVKNSEE